MVNPMMVYTHNFRIFSHHNCQKDYIAILESAKTGSKDGDNELIKKGLTDYCDKLNSIYEKELLRTKASERNKL